MLASKYSTLTSAKAKKTPRLNVLVGSPFGLFTSDRTWNYFSTSSKNKTEHQSNIIGVFPRYSSVE